MKLFFSKTITLSLLLMLSLCCLMFVALSGCQAGSPGLLQGGFCQAEQTSGPMHSAMEMIQPATVVEELSLFAIAALFVLVSILNFAPVVMKRMFNRMIRLVRSGPFTRRMLLPYSMQPHGG